MRTLLLAIASFLIVPTAHAYEARHIFLANRGGSTIVELDESLAIARVWFAADGLSAPNGMAFTPSGDLWVADTFNDRIVAFDSAGTLVRTLDTGTRLGSAVESIYFAGDGTLFATSNPGVGRVARYSITGAELDDVVLDDAFRNLGNVNLTAAGDVIVSDFSNLGRGLRELDPDTGAILRTFGTDLMLQEDVMIDGADRVFVSHYAADEIVVFGADRAELFRFTTPETEAAALAGPTGIVLTWDCRILVAGFRSDRLYEWRHRGAEPPEYVGSVAIDGVTDPESLAIAGLALPGGFTEFADTVPSCDAPVGVDAGPRPDAGRDGGVDAGASDRDAGSPDAGRRAPPAEDGCSCRAVGTDRSAGGVLTWALALMALMARRARRSR